MLVFLDFEASSLGKRSYPIAMDGSGVLHLNCAPEIGQKRVDEDGDSLPPPPDGRSYLDRMFKKALGVGH